MTALALFSLSILAPAPSEARRRRRRASPEAASPPDNPFPVFPGAKPDAKATDRFMESNDADKAAAYSVAAPYAKVVKFYKARLSSDATFESESDVLYLVGKEGWQVRVEKVGGAKSRLIISRKSAPPASSGPAPAEAQAAPEPADDGSAPPSRDGMDGPPSDDGASMQQEGQAPRGRFKRGPNRQTAPPIEGQDGPPAEDGAGQGETQEGPAEGQAQ